ncbi:MAG: acylaminoacyl-peptidase, partial [Chloroflexota bacterium]|nr:acylaminoacyl-peptidase [Chloroflexota bacterium]
QRLAYTIRSAFRHDIWIASADGSGARQVTTGGFCRAPTWSPDGTWIAFLSAQAGTFDVWAVPLPPPAGAASGGEVGVSGAPRQITKGGVVDAGSGIAWAQ